MYYIFLQIVVAVITTNSNAALCRACGVIKYAHTVETEEKEEIEGGWLQPWAEPDCCRCWKCFNSEPTSADEIVSWVVTKGHCGLITSSEMVSEFLCGVTHTLWTDFTRSHSFQHKVRGDSYLIKTRRKCEKTQKEQSLNWNISLNYYVIIGL